MTILRRGVAFSAVGFLGSFVHLGLLLLLTNWLGAHYLVATALAVEAAVIHNFLWHEHWTWIDRTGRAPGGRWGRLLRFNLATGCVSIAGNLALMQLYAGLLHIPTPLAALCSIASCWLVNFVATDRLVFPEIERCPRHHSAHLPSK